MASVLSVGESRVGGEVVWGVVVVFVNILTPLFYEALRGVAGVLLWCVCIRTGWARCCCRC